MNYRPRWIDDASTQTPRIPSVDTLAQTERALNVPSGEMWIAPARGEKHHRRADCEWLLCAKVTKSYLPCNYCCAPARSVGSDLGRESGQSSHPGGNVPQPNTAASSSSSPSVPSGSPHRQGYRYSSAESSQREDWQQGSGAQQAHRRYSAPGDFVWPETYDEFRRQFGPVRLGRSG